MSIEEVKNKDKYFGFGLKDRNGENLDIGDKVIFMGEEQILKLIKWEHYAYPDQKRIAIGKTMMWLTPETSKMCDKVITSLPPKLL